VYKAGLFAFAAGEITWAELLARIESLPAFLSRPASVASSVGVVALDAILNRRIIQARSDVDAAHWMTVKVDIKRRLAAVPHSQVESAARAALVTLD
jgi:hypothetical protein